KTPNPAARLSSGGGYELQLTNGADLAYLSPANPAVTICLSSRFIKDWGLNALLGRVAGAVVFLIGLGILFLGLLAGKRPAHSAGAAHTPIPSQFGVAHHWWCDTEYPRP